MGNKLSSFLLIIVAFIWGTAFVAQTSGMKSMGPFTFTAFRLLIGGIVILPFSYFYFRKKNHFELKSITLMIFMSLALLIGALFQQVALLYTNVANVAFLTALYVPIVPLIYFLYLKKPVSKSIIVSAFLCILGVWFLSENELEFGSYGDILSIIGAFFLVLTYHSYFKVNSNEIRASCNSSIPHIFSWIDLLSTCLFDRKT
jgi:drug/metabolite transporter (DMT)-like permease